METRDDGGSDALWRLDPAAHRALATSRPWASDKRYFREARVSALAAVRMALHCEAGGDREVMGVLLGGVVGRSFVVLDAIPLPVEGTETRVNAGEQAYEHLVRRLGSGEAVGRTDALVGWYHSHPGYGCWLSGVDVGTQRVNQSFQEPFLAIVVDPKRTAEAGKLDIGAFRTFPEGEEEGGGGHGRLAGGGVEERAAAGAPPGGGGGAATGGGGGGGRAARAGEAGAAPGSLPPEGAPLPPFARGTPPDFAEERRWGGGPGGVPSRPASPGSGPREEGGGGAATVAPGISGPGPAANPPVTAPRPPSPWEEGSESDEEPPGGRRLPGSKVEDFGAHANSYYKLRTSFFRSSLDSRILDTLVARDWVRSFSSNSVSDALAAVGLLPEDVAGRLAAAERTISETSGSGAAAGAGGGAFGASSAPLHRRGGARGARAGQPRRRPYGSGPHAATAPQSALDPTVAAADSLLGPPRGDPVADPRTDPSMPDLVPMRIEGDSVGPSPDAAAAGWAPAIGPTTSPPGQAPRPIASVPSLPCLRTPPTSGTFGWLGDPYATGAPRGAEGEGSGGPAGQGGEEGSHEGSGRVSSAVALEPPRPPAPRPRRPRPTDPGAAQLERAARHAAALASELLRGLACETAKRAAFSA